MNLLITSYDYFVVASHFYDFLLCSLMLLLLCILF